MIIDGWFLYVIAIGFTLLISLIGLIIYLIYRKNSSKVAYEQQLNQLIASDDEFTTNKSGIFYKWNQYWNTIFKDSGWVRYNEDASKAGKEAFIFIIIASVVISLLTRNAFLGPMITGIVIVVFINILKMKNERESQRLNEQLPGFLAALKANIQANTTPERAMLKVIDDMPTPLYEDLIVSKQQILANTPFVETIQNLSARTKSKDLKFLCASMLQAVASGASLEDQIETIQNVLERRQKVNDEIKKAINSATPAIYVASVAIPLLFFATYFLNDATREYWFVDPTSWIALIVVIALWVAGILMTKKLVDNIKKL